MLTVLTKRTLKTQLIHGSLLVTGGAGFIGSHICKALAAHGFLPVAFNDLSRRHADFVRWGPLVNGDILDPSRAQCGPGAVIHFAALPISERFVCHNGSLS